MQTLPFLVNRLIWLVPTLFALVTLMFILTRVIPIDPAIMIAGENASQAQIEQIRDEFGLRKPLVVQYASYVTALSRGDLGISLYTQRPIAEELTSRLPATIELTFASLLIAALLGTPSGVLAGIYNNTLLDHALRVAAVVGVGLAHFWIAIQLQLIFSMDLDWFPLSGRVEGMAPQGPTGLLLVDTVLSGDWPQLMSAIQHLALPALTIGLPAAAVVQRFTRNSIINNIDAPFITYQIAMGYSRRKIVWKYLLRTSLAATVSLFGLTAGVMLAGVVAVETVFDWPGMGSYAVRSIMYSDYNAVMGFTLFAGTLFALLSVLVDVLQVIIDPRGVA
ncbi:ABC transporter permease [Rhizobium leguminosarum]|uniref:ABC transporter permease n=1 Tax=Rhizobium leguminosarum TaxID=384 RepID=UPI003F946EF1